MLDGQLNILINVAKVDIQQKLQSMIWKFRSSINVKEPIFPMPDEPTDDKLYNLFQKLSSELDDHSFKLLFKNWH